MNYLLVLFLLIPFAGNAQLPALSITGRVTGYAANRIGDYDGIRLQPDTGKAVALRFPPHTASEVMRAGPVGRRVDAGVIADRLPHRGGADGRQPGPADRYRLVRLRESATGAGFDLAGIPPPPPKAGTLVEKEGGLTGTLTDERGHLAGLLIDNLYLIELRPHQSNLVRALLGNSRHLGFSGYQRPAAGFVNQTGRTVIRPQTLTINGKTYAF